MSLCFRSLTKFFSSEFGNWLLQNTRDELHSSESYGSFSTATSRGSYGYPILYESFCEFITIAKGGGVSHSQDLSGK